MIRNKDLQEIANRGELSDKVLKGLIEEHQNACVRFNKLDDYYKGKHQVFFRKDQGDGRPNNKIMHNYAKYIVVMSVGYLLGDRVKYTSDLDISAILTRYKKANFSDCDEEIAKDVAIFGRGFELLYLDGESRLPRSHVIDPRSIFTVYSDTPKREKLFSVYYYPNITEIGKQDGFCINIYTKENIYEYRTKNLSGPYEKVCSSRHFFKEVPVVEYFNNEEAVSDFEDVLSLIDAYNILQSDRVNDVERFVQAILFLKNFSITDADVSILKERRILQANGANDVDAKWLSHALDQSGVEIIRKTVEADIHKFSFVPAITDEHFSGNASGVALKYKLIGLSQMNKIKKRYMERGLKERLGLCLDLPNFKPNISPHDINIEFLHSLPVNDLETAKMVSELSGIVKNETLLKQLSFVRNPKEEAA